MRHGTVSGYKYHRCRCSLCLKAVYDYNKKLKVDRKSKPKFVYPKPLAHGTANAYSYHNCRCELCQAFIRGYRMGLKIRNAEPSTATPTEPEYFQLKHECGTASAYSFGCKCELCLTQGRELYLQSVKAA